MQPDDAQRQAATGESDSPSSRAMVPLRASARGHAIPPEARAASTFVAHLLAIAEGAPQTRTLRRASADDAMCAYRSTLSLSNPASDIRSARMI